MALTLLEGNKYSRTELAGYVIDLLAKDSEILMHLPFVSIMGNSLTYDMITTRSGAGFYSVGGTWTESTQVMTQDTATLSILGGDADVDNFVASTRSNILDVQGEVLKDKIKAVREKYLDTFYYGSGTTPEFKGMQGLISSTTYNTVVSNSSAVDGAAASTAKLQQAIDLVTGYKPTHLAMSKTMRRLLQTYIDSVGSSFPTQRDQYGKMQEYFRGLIIIPDDHITITESTTAAGVYSTSTDDDQTTLWILTFDSKACCGIQGKNGIETIPLGDLETKDAKRWRIRWYCGAKFEDLRSCAKYCGILSGSAWTA